VAVTVDWLVGSVVHGSHGGGHRGVDGVDGVSNNWGGVDGVSNNGGSVVGGSDNGGSVVGGSNNGGSVVGGSNLDNGSCLVSWGRGWDIRLGLGVDSGSLVGDLSDIAVISVGGVGHLLDPAVGESHSVGTLDIAGTIGGLLSVEVGLGVVISNGVCEGVGRDLISVLLGLVSNGGWLVSNGGWLVSNRGRSISWGSVDGVSNNWSSVDGVGNNWSSVVSDRVGNKWGGMNTMVNTMVGNQRSCMDGVVGGSVVDSVVGNWSNSVVRDDGGLANWDDLVGSNGGLDLSQTLGVVHLAH